MLPAAYRDAYYELVLYEIKATANLYALRRAEFTNILYTKQSHATTNDLTKVAQAHFDDDQTISKHYNDALAGKKGHDFQTQPHIDYGDMARYGPNAPWQQPEIDNEALPDVIFPALQRVDPPPSRQMGVAIDGSERG